MSHFEVGLEEIARLRAENRRRIERKQAHVQFRELDDWFEEAAPASSRPIEHPDLRVGFSARSLPWGPRWSGLIVAETANHLAHAWFNEIDGDTPDDRPVVVREGAARVSAASTRRLMKIFRDTPAAAFVPVPDRCYDGAPTTIRVGRPGETVEARANAADSGSEPALVLARLIWEIKAATRMSETQRYSPEIEP